MRQPLRHSVLVATALALPLTASCSRAPDSPVDEGQKIVQAALQILTSDGKGICVDSRTTGRPLAIYAAMRIAPAASRRPLAWHVPGQLRPPDTLSTAQLYRDSLGSDQAHLHDPQSAGAVLPRAEQSKLDLAATNLSRDAVGSGIAISPRWAPGVRARWWPINRLSRSCAPTYTLSNPVWSGTTGYIAVMTEHWGTIYAFDRSPSGWKSIGQWSNWLY